MMGTEPDLDLADQTDPGLVPRRRRRLGRRSAWR